MVLSSQKRLKLTNLITGFFRSAILFSLPLIILDNFQIGYISSKTLLVAIGGVLSAGILPYAFLRKKISAELSVLVFLGWVALAGMRNPPVITSNTLLLYFLSLIYFLVSSSIPKDVRYIKKIALVLFFVGICLSLFNLLGVFLPDKYLDIIKKFFPVSAGQINYDYNRGRLKNLGPLNIISPFAVIGMSNPYISLLVQSIFVLSLSATAYRMRIVSGLIGMILGLLVYRNKIYFLIAAFIIAGALSYVVFPSSFVTRFTLQNTEDLDTIRSRIELLKEGISLAARNPLFGVGPGNYQAHVANFTQPLDKDSISYRNPHNFSIYIAAEFGMIGLAIYLLMMFNFFIYDLRNFRSYEKQLKIISLSSWSFFISSHLDWYSVHNLLYFFILRGLLVRRNTQR